MPAVPLWLTCGCCKCAFQGDNLFLYQEPASLKHVAAGKGDTTGVPPSATWTRLRFAFASCLQSALSQQGSETLEQPEELDTDPDSAAAFHPDPRALLILQLLLAGLQGPAPSLTHLLMGFDVTKASSGELA